MWVGRFGSHRFGSDQVEVELLVGIVQGWPAISSQGLYVYRKDEFNTLYDNKTLARKGQEGNSGGSYNK